MMNDVFSEEMHEGFLIIYMDDLMIFMCNMSKAEHAKLVKQILQKLRENNLFIKLFKCTFFVKSINFLEMIMSKDGMLMDPTKIATINDYQVPHNVKGVYHFFGMANF